MSIAFETQTETFNNTTRRIYTYVQATDTYTQQTTSNNLPIFDSTSVAGDAILFMHSFSQRAPARFRFDIATAMNATDLVLKWYVGTYDTKIIDGSYPVLTWKDITSVIQDDTNGFTTTGVNDVILNCVKDFVLGRAGPLTGTTDRHYWIKCEIDSVTSITNGAVQANTSVLWGSNVCRITGNYYQGTVSSYAASNRIDTSGLSTGQFNGRAVWLPNSDNKWNKFPVKQTDSTRIFLGVEVALNSAGTCISRLNPNDLPATSDPFVISYTMEDVLEACNTAGLDWVKGYCIDPVRQEHLYYELICSVVLDSNVGTEYTFLSGFCQHYTLYGNHFLQVDSSAEASIQRTKFMFGVQLPAIKSDGSYELNDGLIGMGCTIHFVTHRNQRALFLSGDFNGCIFNGGTANSFQTTIELRDANVFNSSFGFCQLQHHINCEGRLLMHSPVAEPFKNPYSTNKITEFRAGWFGYLYAVGTGPYTMDSPSSNDVSPIKTWSTFNETGIINIIDKNPQTLFTCRFMVAANSTSGIVKFFFRTNFQVRGSGDEVTPIEGATICVRNKNGDIEFEDTTDANGNALNNGDVGDTTSNQILYGTMQAVNSTGSTLAIPKTEVDDEMGPFTVTVEKAGYETIVLPFTGDKRNDLVITMKKAIPVMMTDEGEGLVRADPTNTTVNRGLLLK